MSENRLEGSVWDGGYDGVVFYSDSEELGEIWFNFWKKYFRIKKIRITVEVLEAEG